MKKYLLLIVLLVCGSLAVNAQFSFQPAQFTFGVKAGGNSSTISSNTDLHSSALEGFQVGVFARFGGDLYIQTEFYYDRSGGKFNTTDNKINDAARIHSMDFPILLGKSFGNKKFSFRVLGGVYLSALDYQNEFSRPLELKYNDFGVYTDHELGYQAGAGVDIGPITADIRYQGALTYLNSASGERLHLVAISIGYKFF